VYIRDDLLLRLQAEGLPYGQSRSKTRKSQMGQIRQDRGRVSILNVCVWSNFIFDWFRVKASWRPLGSASENTEDLYAWRGYRI